MNPLSRYRNRLLKVCCVCFAVPLTLVTPPIAVPAQEGKAAPTTPTTPDERGWVPLFNGRDLNDWIIKIRFHEIGENFANTFRVEDGMLKVGYEGYDKFNETFGHIFYKHPYSHYRLRVEYRFIGDQCPGGPGWAFRNSGVMIHGESPETMTRDQDFPASIEVQLLGGNGQQPRTTSNLCTPGTNVVMDDKLVLRHCTSSTSETYHGDQWVTAEIEVRGNEVIKHILDGKIVLEYSQPQLDDRDTHSKELIAKADGNHQLSGGTISLQSESHPVHFRKVEIMDLSPEAARNPKSENTQENGSPE